MSNHMNISWKMRSVQCASICKIRNRSNTTYMQYFEHQVTGQAAREESCIFLRVKVTHLGADERKEGLKSITVGEQFTRFLSEAPQVSVSPTIASFWRSKLKLKYSLSRDQCMRRASGSKKQSCVVFKLNSKLGEDAMRILYLINKY